MARIFALRSCCVVKRNQENEPALKPQKRTRTAFANITNRDVVTAVNGGKRAVAKKSAVVKAAAKKKSTDTAAVTFSKTLRHLNGVATTSTAQQLIGVVDLSSQDSNASSQSSNVSEFDVDTLVDVNPNLCHGSPLHDEVIASSAGVVDLIAPVGALSTAATSTPAPVPVAAAVVPVDQREVWEDVDAETLDDPLQVGLYAAEIFEYYKRREAQFVIGDYMPMQHDLKANMRAILVDWLVEVQENFELNHETLYLGVKLVDHFLCREQIKKNRLQLLGATAMFVAAKFDERYPPVMDDFLYVCDDAYTRDQVKEMERTLLKVVEFDIGMPLSYRFLRRFAKCARVDLITLTLARYILEMSLLDYYLIRQSDCKLAVCALMLAKMLRGDLTWGPTMRHYSGYSVDDVRDLLDRLHRFVTKPTKLMTIRTKYKHAVFHGVAKMLPLKHQGTSDSGSGNTSTDGAGAGSNSETS